MRLATILWWIVVGAGASSASGAPQESARPFQAADYQFFEKKVRPLLLERCFNCHSSRSKKQKGELRLDSRANILKGGLSGPAAVPGRPDKSLLIEAVRYQNESLQMPPKGKLPDRVLAIFEEWVRRGVPFPEPPDAIIAKKPVGLDAARKFWSFQPPRQATPPAIRERAWPRKRMDTFVLAELEKRGLGPSSPAGRRTLIRRATFDLIGLPPTPEEVAAFCNDQAHDAYERLLERLLASPLYGERWGRFWLDLARYCDIGEPWMGNKSQPWLYRDWVVRAFNDDLPYNEFVIRQLAADQLPNARPCDRAALGFLGLSPTYWKELKLDKDVIKTVVAEEWEERIDAVARTFLGLSVACARCHDHKFDPISTHDYYALAGVFASTRRADRSLLPEALDLPVRRAHQRVQSLEGEITKLQTRPVPANAKQDIAKLKADIEHIKKTTPHYDALLAPAVEDASLLVLADGPHRTRLEYKPGVAQDVCVQVRGNPGKPGAVVPRRFLAVLSPGVPQPFKQGSGRLELARAIVNEGAPLAARVIVNRVWKLHFGAGLVETPSDFGAQGARPSHPQLLDDLTARFSNHGWSLKWLHREIMRSATYRQTSRRHDRRQYKVDPDNRWLGRMNRRRLEIEAWRDAMLAVTMTLRLTQGGPAQDLGDPRNRRRTLYGTIKRRELSDLLRLHDVPDATLHSPARVPTTTPLQQLFVLNGPLIQEQAATLVTRIQAEGPGNDEARIRRAYQLLYQRAPTKLQIKVGVEFLHPGAEDAKTLWRQYAQVLLGSNEFLYVD